MSEKECEFPVFSAGGRQEPCPNPARHSTRDGVWYCSKHWDLLVEMYRESGEEMP